MNAINYSDITSRQHYMRILKTFENKNPCLLNFRTISLIFHIKGVH